MPSTPNWKNLQKLRDRIASQRDTKSKKFMMREFIQILSGKRAGELVSVGELRRNGPDCGSACCLAGETVIAFAPVATTFRVFNLGAYFIAGLVLRGGRISTLAQRLLGLNNEEANWMFSGRWAVDGSGYTIYIDTIKRRHAIRYLDEAIKERDVMVRVKCLG